ncbi:MAG: PDZ domain-containing protein [Planctomycetota bacterium]
MSKTKLLTISLIFAVLVVAGLALFLFSSRAEDKVLSQPAAVEKASAGLGIVYIPVTRGLSEYYGLGVDYGALVTEVIPGSPADRGGVQVGDVIMAFNEATLEPQTRLLGMMMACPAGRTVTLEVRRGTETAVIEIFHTTGQK